MQCEKCGETVPSGVRFCPRCGAACSEPDPAAAARQPLGPADPLKKETGGFDPADVEANRTVSGFAYLLFFLPLIVCPGSRYGRFHANQALVLLLCGAVAGAAVSVLSGILLTLSWRLWYLLSLVQLLVWVPLTVLGIMGMVNGFTGKAKTLPVIGGLNIIK